jgi:hypothetical protein
MVKLNYYKLDFDRNPEWIQYKIDIVLGKKQRNYDEEKKFIGFDIIANPRKEKPLVGSVV